MAREGRMNDLLQCPDSPNPPPCWNRPPVQSVSVRHGIDSATGEPIRVEVRSDWFTDRCAIHDGRGIGPNGENYPEARGWLAWCNTCRWNPAQRKE